MGIQLVDLGASGKPPEYWQPIAHLVNLTGFEPNKSECERLELQKSKFNSIRFLPFAIADERKRCVLHETESPFCWSLLEPNQEWLDRFTFADLFRVNARSEIVSTTLEESLGKDGFKIDAIKLDTQGLELPILNSSASVLSECIMIETETGFVDNYVGETKFADVAEYMRDHSYGLFSMNSSHPVARKNANSKRAQKEQILWCESIWFRDFVQEAKRTNKVLSRTSALKALCIYANHGCLAFGLEMAELFYEQGLLELPELDALRNRSDAWKLGRPTVGRIIGKCIRPVLHWIPRRFHVPVIEQLQDLHDIPHPLAPHSSSE